MAMVLFGMSEQAGQHLLLAGNTIFYKPPVNNITIN